MDALFPTSFVFFFEVLPYVFDYPRMPNLQPPTNYSMEHVTGLEPA